MVSLWESIGMLRRRGRTISNPRFLGNSKGNRAATIHTTATTTTTTTTAVQQKHACSTRLAFVTATVFFVFCVRAKCSPGEKRSNRDHISTYNVKIGVLAIHQILLG